MNLRKQQRIKMKNKMTAVLVAVFCITALSSCQKKENVVTFDTVSTKGVTAYIAADNGTSATEGEEEITFASETPVTTEAKTTTSRTKHYETTIPVTLIGGTTADTTEQSSESTDVTTLAPATEAISTETAPEITQVVSEGYAEIDDSGLMVCEIDGHYWGLMPCWGTYGLCESWTEAVNEFKRQLPSINVYNMVVPTSAEFYTPEGFDNFTASQWKKAEHIRVRLENVVNVDAYSALAAHTHEAVYSRTDHHWMPLGAYYAAMSFAKAADVPFPSLEEYKKVSRGGFVGSMYMYTESKLIYNDPEQFDLYIPPNNSSLETAYYDGYMKNKSGGQLITSPDAGAYYCSFLGTDNIVAEIGTDVKNGRTLVIFKESYGNALVPFLTSSFEKIYVCDIRYFYNNALQFCKDVNATDLLFSVCTFTAAGPNGNYLEKLLNY